MFLLHPDVVSLRRRPNCHSVTFQWLESQRQADLHLSAVTLAEPVKQPATEGALGLDRNVRQATDSAASCTRCPTRT
ncbi:MAG: hypothetical protein OXG36_17130, partial [Caldilineaceae bacterium]|nr:hypothetical protein [Caldilineaceae bacterium]